MYFLNVSAIKHLTNISICCRWRKTDEREASWFRSVWFINGETCGKCDLIQRISIFSWLKLLWEERYGKGQILITRYEPTVDKLMLSCWLCCSSVSWLNQISDQFNPTCFCFHYFGSVKTFSNYSSNQGFSTFSSQTPKLFMTPTTKEASRLH